MPFGAVRIADVAFGRTNYRAIYSHRDNSAGSAINVGREKKMSFFYVFFLSGNDLKLSRTREKGHTGKERKRGIRFFVADGVEKRAGLGRSRGGELSI